MEQARVYSARIVSRSAGGAGLLPLAAERRKIDVSLFAVKPLSRIFAESEEKEHQLKRTLGAWQLIALGIGAVIGAGIFVRTAAAIAERAGASVTIAFI